MEPEGIWVVKDLRGALIATDDYGRGRIRKLKLNAPTLCTIKQPRHGPMHRKLWALVNVVWQSTGNWETPAELMRELKIRLGILEKFLVEGIGWVTVVGSISYANMDQSAFEVFFEGALRKLCEMAGNIDRDSLRQAVLEELSH